MKYSTSQIPLAYKKLNGGLNTTSGPLGLQANESPDLQNIDFDKFGSLKQRNGYTALNSSAVASERIDGLFWFMTPTLRKPIMVCDDKVYRMDSLDGTWDDITGSESITKNHRFDFENFNSAAIMTNDYDVPLKWTGAGNVAKLDVPTGLTRAKFVTKFQNYCFLANVVVSGSDLPSRFYFSGLRDITSWSAADFYEISKDDGEEITGFKVLGDRLVVYKTNSIYVVSFTGNSDVPFVINKSNSHVGCIAPYSIQEVNNGHVFLSYDGLYFFDGSNSYKLSDKVNSTILGFSKSNYPDCVSMYQKNKNRYWLAFATLSNNNRVLTWDSYNNAFSLYTGMAPSAMAIFLVNGVEERPYWGDFSGFVYRGDTGNNDYPLNVKTAINAYYWTNWKDFDELTDTKGIPHVYIYHQDTSATLSFSYAYDFSDTAYATNTFSTSVSGSPTSVIKRQDLQGRGRSVALKFLNSSADETFQIDGIGMKALLDTNV